MFNTRFPNPTASKVLAFPCSRHGSRTPLPVEFWHSRVQRTVPVLKARFPNPTASGVLATASGVLAVPSSTHGYRTPLLVESRVQHTVRESHCQWGSGSPIFNARFPNPTVSGVLCSTDGSRIPLPVGFWHSRFQGTVPEPHCQWSSGRPVFNARFANHC